MWDLNDFNQLYRQAMHYAFDSIKLAPSFECAKVALEINATKCNESI